MAKKSKLICPKCHQRGGILTLRRAGNPKIKEKYYYIQHYEYGSKKQCYIGHKNLAEVKLNDVRYYREYKQLIEELSLTYNGIGSYDGTALQPLYQLLIGMGWPDKAIPLRDKVRSDVYKMAFQREKEKIAKMSHAELVELDEKIEETRKKALANWRKARNHLQAIKEKFPDL